MTTNYLTIQTWYILSMSNFIFAINTVLPVFLLIILGIILKRVNILDDGFIRKSSKLVFTIALPVLIFRTISRASFGDIYDSRVVILTVAIITTGSFILFIISNLLIKSPSKLGAFVQASFRGNTAIVGLAIIYNLYGDKGVAAAALPMVFIFPMYNIYSVLALSIPQHGSKKSSKDILLSIIKNPLISAVLIALPFTLFSIEIPMVVDTFLGYISRMTLPLALLGVGASLNFHSFRKVFLLTTISSFIKLVIFPVITLIAALLSGLKGMNLGVLVILLGCPTAISSYIMADVMGGDRDLTAGVILLTTLGSILSMGIGIFLLKYYSLI